MIIDIFNTSKQYNIIYADPPWSYDNNLSNRTDLGAAPYPRMSLEDICNLPISKLSRKDSILFLWATMPKLQEAFIAIKAWGFKYKTCAFCWVKENPKSGGIYSGLGHWTNGNAELCLLATKGHPQRKRKNIKQIVLSPRSRHSQKPYEIRERIVQLMGDIPRLELFARETANGWDCWGNEF